jgi:hypothetical protein
VTPSYLKWSGTLRAYVVRGPVDGRFLVL